MLRQAVVVMVRPVRFFCNEATCGDNHFQDAAEGASTAESAAAAAAAAVEHGAVEAAIRAAGVPIVKRYDMAADLEAAPAVASKPDAIFPNNSISFHDVAATSLTAAVASICGPDAAAAVSSAASACSRALVVMLHPMCPGRVDEIPLALQATVRAMTAVSLRATRLDTATGAVEFVLQPSQGSNCSGAGGPPVVVVDLRAFERVNRMSAGSGCTTEGEYWAMEGTGAINFTPCGEYAFACASLRCHPVVFHLVCALLAIPVERRFLFPRAADAQGRSIYHTNVVGWVGDGMCAWNVGALCFADEEEETTTPTWCAATLPPPGLFYCSRERFEESLKTLFPAASGGVLDISEHAMAHFAGNALFLRGEDGEPFVAMSQAAHDALLLPAAAGTGVLSPASLLERAIGGKLVVVPIPTIERLGGGSLRCLLAACFVGDAVAPVLRRILQTN